MGLPMASCSHPSLVFPRLPWGHSRRCAVANGVGHLPWAVYHPSISFSDIYVPVFCLVFDWIISYVVVQRSFIEYVICKYFSLSLWPVLFPLFTLFKEVRSV